MAVMLVWTVVLLAGSGRATCMGVLVSGAVYAIGGL
jgi:hypothetical protein